MDLFRLGPRCLCENCSPDAPGKTYTRSWLAACEIRFVVAMPSNADRRRYIEGVEKQRGQNAAVRLRDAVWKEMKVIL